MSKHSGHRSRWLVAAAAAGAAMVLLRRLFPVRVEGPSMRPTLQPGDLVACSRLRGSPEPGAIVVVRGSVDVIKRVAAVREDRVSLVGDNLAASTDSRTRGPVALGDVLGVARAIYWPPRRWRMLTRVTRRARRRA